MSPANSRRFILVPCGAELAAKFPISTGRGRATDYIDHLTAAHAAGDHKVGDCDSSKFFSRPPPTDDGAKAMFESGPIEGVVFKPLARHADDRGWLIECFRSDELPTANLPLMTYVSATLPGTARGPHDHAEQSDYFAFIGPGELKLYLWDGRKGSPTFGNRQTVIVGESNRQAVIIPPGVVHAYKNVGQVPAWVVNCPNRLYAGHGRREPVDEIRYEKQADSPYVLD
jgi:dTDP-4-dehydrorhamnose 3,5-epimerase